MEVDKIWPTTASEGYIEDLQLCNGCEYGSIIDCGEVVSFRKTSATWGGRCGSRAFSTEVSFQCALLLNVRI